MNNFRTVIFVEEGHVGEVDVDTLMTADVVIEVGKEMSKVYKHRYLPREKFSTNELSLLFRSALPEEWRANE